MFKIHAGTKVKLIKEGKEWYAHNFLEYTTTVDTIFEKHEIVIDPVGRISCHAGYVNTIGGQYAKAGWYGFKRQNEQDLTEQEKKQVGWVLLVPMSQTEYLD